MDEANVSDYDLLEELKEQTSILKDIKIRENEAFTDLYRELREIKIQLLKIR